MTVNHLLRRAGPTECADLRRILVFAGEGPDRISLVDVTPAAFDRLTSTSVSDSWGTMSLSSGVGDDLIGGGGRFADGRRGAITSRGPGGGEVIGGKGRDTVSLAGDGDGRSTTHDRARPSRRDHDLEARSRVRGRQGGTGANLIFGDSFTEACGSRVAAATCLQAGEGNDRILGGERTTSSRRVPATTRSRAARGTTR